jgi:hypothetical protein
MPIAYLDVPPGIDRNQKAALMQALYAALHEAYPFPDDHRIFLREWPLDSASRNGALGAEPVRPVFLIHGPQGVDPDAKRSMLKKIHAAVDDAYHRPDFMIFMHEYPLDLVAHEGGLLADDQKRVADQKQAYS